MLRFSLARVGLVALDGVAQGQQTTASKVKPITCTVTPDFESDRPLRRARARRHGEAGRCVPGTRLSPQIPATILRSS